PITVTEELLAIREAAADLDYVSHDALAETADRLGVLGDDWIDARHPVLRVDDRFARIALVGRIGGAPSVRGEMRTISNRHRPPPSRPASRCAVLPQDQFCFEPRFPTLRQPHRPRELAAL